MNKKRKDILYYGVVCVKMSHCVVSVKGGEEVRFMPTEMGDH